MVDCKCESFFTALSVTFLNFRLVILVRQTQSAVATPDLNVIVMKNLTFSSQVCEEPYMYFLHILFNLLFSLFLHKIIFCGYSLEVPPRHF